MTSAEQVFSKAWDVDWDEGETPIALTSVGSIGKAVVAVLEGRHGETKTEVRVKDVTMTQKRLLELAKKVTGEEGWVVDRWDTAKGVAAAEENLRNGIPDRTLAFLKRAVAVGGYGSVWTEEGPEKDDSEVVGLRDLSEEEVIVMIRGTVAKNQGQEDG